MGIAEEGLDVKVMEKKMECKLGTIVKSSRLPPKGREQWQRAAHGIGYRLGGLTMIAFGYNQSRTTLVQGENRLAIPSKLHQVSFPVPWCLAITGLFRALRNRATEGDK